jgi:cell division protein FtsQ
VDRRSRILDGTGKPIRRPADKLEIRKRNRRILRSVLIAFLAADGALMVLLGYLLVLHSAYFTLQQVDVMGNRHLSRAEVVEASEVERGTNLLTVDLGDIAGRLKRHPWVRSSSVYRRFPGRLMIEIEERIPRAVVAVEKLYYVDQQSEIFTRLLPGDPVDLPLFTGVKPEDLQAHGPEVRDLIRSGLNFLDVLEKSGADLQTAEIAEVRLDLDDGLSLYTSAGRIIVLGKGDFENKIQRYGRLKKFLVRTGDWATARVINLDFEDRAIVRSDGTRLQG